MTEAVSAQRPLDFGIVKRLYACTRPYGRLRTLLLGLVVLRSLQLPVIAWLVAWVISGPIAEHHPAGIARGVLAFLGWTALTAWCFIYRSRLALQLGEAVVSDLRRQIYEHLLRLPISYFQRTEVGRLIGRVIHDVDSVRVGVQDVFANALRFVGLVEQAVALGFRQRAWNRRR